MKSIAIVMHVKTDIAIQLTNDRADVARRGAILARLWRWGSCNDWRPASDPRKSWGELAPVAVIILTYDAEAAALIDAAPDEMRPLLRAMRPALWQFVTTTDPAGLPAVSLHGVARDLVDASDESYDHRADLARLHDAPVMMTAN